MAIADLRQTNWSTKLVSSKNWLTKITDVKYVRTFFYLIKKIEFESSNLTICCKTIDFCTTYKWFSILNNLERAGSGHIMLTMDKTETWKPEEMRNNRKRLSGKICMCHLMLEVEHFWMCDVFPREPIIRIKSSLWLPTTQRENMFWPSQQMSFVTIRTVGTVSFERAIPTGIQCS